MLLMLRKIPDIVISSISASRLFACLMLFSLLQETKAQCNGRYQATIFNSVEETSVKYGENINSDGRREELYLDVYEPTGDIELNRPLIIFAHGGAFLNGFDRKSSEIVSLCKSLATMGYVCASFDYRDESNPVAMLSEERIIKAIFRSVQDGKAAIRYFKKSAAEGNPFAIDPDQIIFGGVSAGAVLALDLVYVTDMNMLPWPWNIWVRQLGGGLEGNSGNPGFNTDVKGIINISGAINKPYFLDGNNVPMLHIHGTADHIVSYGAGKPIFGFPLFPVMYGSKIIHEEALERGINSTLISYPGKGHVPLFNNWPFDTRINPEIFDSTIRQISNFAYSLLDCGQVITGLPSDNLNSDIALYPNPTSGQINLTVPDQLAHSNVAIFSATGSEVYNSYLNGKSFYTNLTIPDGLYLLRITSSGNDVNEYFKRLIISR